ALSWAGNALGEAVVQKNLVHNQGKIELPAELRQLFGLPRLGEVAGWIVGMHQHDGPRLRRDGATKALCIDLPAVVVDQRSGLKAHIVQHGQKVKERIARLCYENLAACIAEQPEEEAVGLAGAGGQHDLLRLESNAMVRIVGADGLAGAEQAA